jgi:hypothetical protein
MNIHKIHRTFEHVHVPERKKVPSIAFNRREALFFQSDNVFKSLHFNAHNVKKCLGAMDADMGRAIACLSPVDCVFPEE